MQTVLLGLAVALLWGSADTLAAVVTQRIGSTATTLVAQVAGLLLVACVALVVGLPADLTLHALAESMLSGIVLGAIGALAYLTLYKALEHGPLAVVSPLVSAQGGVTLLAAILILHEMPGIWQMVFLLVIFAGVMLASIDGRAVNQLSALALFSPGVALALVSMAGFGVLAFGLGLAARETNWLFCVVWTRIFSCLLLTIFFRLDIQATVGQEESTSARPQRDWWFWLSGMGAVGVGCGDVGGLLLLALASTTGSIGVVGMVASAYGVVPLLAGILFFKERPAANQVLGVLLLIAGLVGIASPSSILASTSGWLLPGGVGVLLAATGLVLLGSRLRRGRGRGQTREQRACDRPDAGASRTRRRRRLRRTRTGQAAPASAAWTTLWQQMRTLPASRQTELLSLMQEIVTGWQTLPPDLPPVVAFCGSTHVADGDPLHRAARETARLLAEAGCAIMVGGERGIMQAATRGAGEGGMLSIGCLLAPEQAEASEGARAPSEAEDREGADVRLRFRHELARQAVMQASARAFVVFPGGLETLGELGQALAARRAGVCPRFPLVLYDRASWSDLLQWLWMDERREAEAALDGRESVSDPRFRFFFGDTPAAVVGCLLASLFPDLRQSPDATAGSMSGEKRN